MSGLAPLHAEGLDWFAGMAAAGAAELAAATRGRAALVDHLSTTDFDPEQFTPADHAALAGTWSWLGGVAERALTGGLVARASRTLLASGGGRWASCHRPTRSSRSAFR